jgi:hypothetical protein
LNAQGAADVRKTKMHAADPFVPKPIISEFEVAIDKLKSYVTR